MVDSSDGEIHISDQSNGSDGGIGELSDSDDQCLKQAGGFDLMVDCSDVEIGTRVQSDGSDDGIAMLSDGQSSGQSQCEMSSSKSCSEIDVEAQFVLDDVESEDLTRWRPGITVGNFIGRNVPLSQQSEVLLCNIVRVMQSLPHGLLKEIAKCFPSCPWDSRAIHLTASGY